MKTGILRLICRVRTDPQAAEQLVRMLTALAAAGAVAARRYRKANPNTADADAGTAGTVSYAGDRDKAERLVRDVAAAGTVLGLVIGRRQKSEPQQHC